MDDARPPAPPDAQRSRAGDFFYALVGGAVALMGATMLGGLSFGQTSLLFFLFAGILGLRFASLRLAVPVAPAVTFNEEQAQKLERIRAVLNALPQPVMLLDGQGRVEMANAACADTFGSSPLGKHVAAFVRAPAALDALRAVRAEGNAHEAEVPLPPLGSGTQTRTVLFYVAPVGPSRKPLAPDRDRVIVMIRDRTAQKKLETMRSDFVANVSHELRTPLTAMLGFIETIETHARDDEEARTRFLGIMRQQAERMLRLVRDLVSLSAIELDEAATPRGAVNLAELASSVCEGSAPLFERAGAPPPSCEGASPLPVRGDRDQIYQIVQNLIDNALRYGGAEPHVRVLVGRGAPPLMERALRTGDSAAQVAARLGVEADQIAWVRVEDDGEGIPRQDLPRLTERFYRTDVEKSRRSGGTGLGLAIVKHIVQRHRGGLQIESLEGRGSAFTVFLPTASLDKRTERA